MLKELYTDEVNSIVDVITNNKIQILEKLNDIELSKKVLKESGKNMNSYNSLFSMINDTIFSSVLNCEFSDTNGYDILLNNKKISIKGMSKLMLKNNLQTYKFNLLHTYRTSSLYLNDILRENSSDYVLLIQTSSPYSIGITTYDIAKQNAELKAGCVVSRLSNENIRWIIKDELFSNNDISSEVLKNVIYNIEKLISGQW